MSKPYATLTIPEQWDWHAEVYAFRRVVLNINERTSPCDVEGKWFNARLVDEAEQRMRDKRKRQIDAIAAGQTRRAYLSSEENYERLHKLQEELKGTRKGNEKLVHIATALGVKSREYTPEELREGRIALGLEKEETVE